MAGRDCDEMLFQAIRDAKPATLRRLLNEEPCDSNCRMNDEGCTTALILAVKYKKVTNNKDLENKRKCVKMLLRHGANINDCDSHGMTATMYAASMGCVELLTILKDCGANLYAVNHDGLTAAMLATQLGKCACLQLLMNGLPLSHFNEADKAGRTALMHAAIHGQSECLRRLVDFQVALNIVDVKRYSALMHALKKVEIPCAKILLNQKDTNVNIVSNHGNETALTLAFQAVPRDYTLIEDILKRGADLTESRSVQGYLHEMIARNKTAIIRMMVVNDCPPVDKICNQECFPFSYPTTAISPIAVALLSGYTDTARYFIAVRFFTVFDKTTLCGDLEIQRTITQTKNSHAVLPLLRHLRLVFRTSNMDGLMSMPGGPLDSNTQYYQDPKLKPLYQLCIHNWHDAPLENTVKLQECCCQDCRETTGYKVKK